MENKKKKINLKVIAVLGILLLIIGGVVFTVGMTALGWDFTALDTEELTPASYTTNNDIDIVELDGVWNFTVKSGDGFGIEYYTSNKTDIKVKESVDDGKSVLEFEEDYKWSIGVHGLKRSSLSVVVTVVDGCELHIDTASASVTISNTVFSKIEIDSVSLDVVLNNVTADALIVDGTSSDIEINNSSIESLKADIVSSDINASGSEIKSSEIEGVSTDVDYQNCDIYSFSGDGVSIEIELKLIGSKDDFGSIKVSGVSSEIEIDDINGNYIGSGSKTIMVSGTSSDLSVEFVGGMSIY